MTRQQGIVMAFADVFLLLCFLFAAFSVVVWLMRRPPPVTAEVAAH
jgi:DHA2 family multidrug resistance protein